MKRETTHNTYETGVIVLPFYQNPDKVHVLKYESDDCEVYQKLRRIIDNMNRFYTIALIIRRPTLFTEWKSTRPTKW